MRRDVIDTKPREAGFTLIEVLISLFIFAIISAGTLTALTQSLSAKARLGEAVAELNNLNSARAIIQSDMGAIVLRPMRDELGGTLPFRLTTDGEPLLTFMRAGVENPGGLEQRGDLARIEYRFEDGRLIRRSFAHVYPAPNTQSFDRVLLEDLQGAEIQGLIYSLGNFSTSDFLRIEGGAAESLDGIALMLSLTDAQGESTAHIFEMGS